VIAVRGFACMAASATCVALWAGAPVAHAQATAASAVRIDWRAPSGCPSPAAMRDQIADVAGDSMARAGRVQARARPLAGGWIVELDAGDGPRALRGETCAEVARAAALVIGLALRRHAEAQPPAQIADGEVPRWPGGGDPGERMDDHARVERAVPWLRVRRPDIRVRAAVGATMGMLPGWAPMARAGVEAGWASSSIRLEAAAATDDSGLRLPGGEQVDVRSQLVAGVATGCWLTRPLSWCAGVEIGQMRASATAAGDEESGSGLWTAVSAGPSLVAPLADAVALVVQAEAAVPIVFPRFSVNGEPATDPDPVSLRTGLGLHVHIP
jgi:hypothetical protein